MKEKREIKLFEYPFSYDGLIEIRGNGFGVNWPLVYIIHNEKEAYIGETSNSLKRTKNHLDSKNKKHLKQIVLICDERFNKSAILDIEHLLIDYMNADQKYKLLNLNNGQSLDHDYYQKQLYVNMIDSIWKELRKKEIVQNELNVLRNSDLFKFSPYKTLNSPQYEISETILDRITMEYSSDKKIPFIIEGSAGTGKTILAVYIMKKLSEYIRYTYNLADLEDEDEEDQAFQYHRTVLKNRDFTFAIVIPQTSLRKTLKRVFRRIAGLKASMVLGPMDVTKKKYDLLIVDEAHRLTSSRGITNIKAFYNANEKLGFDRKKGNQLDWILHQSRFQILFYDPTQSVRPSDLDRSFFKKVEKSQYFEKFSLDSQMRVRGGKDYIQFIDDVLHSKSPQNAGFPNYELRLFDHIEDMENVIKKKEEAVGLCRMVSGYAWEWKSKTDPNCFDIKIEGKEYCWNSTTEDWINSVNSLEEIGSIHTVQGYDLNYAGVILGNDIGYDPNKQEVIICKESYFDQKGKQNTTPETLAPYILNIYKVLLTRGIMGTYLYVCDPALREYIRNCIQLH
ncbi:DUF2075 domain-containing protein [Dubosiella newyorkensis]|jgi:DUF2075 family protein/DNA replication protein DnaC|nr:DUF2075 domain-containing protein [Dubosiella newyorkensis]MCI9041315.1 DUF2075 domain-containing protein [Dubosiella newyorkensis]